MHGFIFCVAAILALTAVSANEKKVVCYFGSWSVYRPGKNFNINDIDPNLCTHLIYAFAGVQNDKIRSLDSWADFPDGKDGYHKFNDLRNRNPSIKTMLAIGGWNHGSAQFSAMASSPSARKEFIRSIIPFLQKHSFNGLDLDWEYPAQRDGSKPQDVQNFVELVKELKAEFVNHGLLLSAAVAAPEISASKSYKIKELGKYLDFINIMAYDMHTGLETQTGMHSGLYGSSASDKLSVDAAVNYWLQKGCPPEKLIVGVPTYGKTWTLANPTSNGVGAPAIGQGTPGPFTADTGFLGYYEICKNIVKGGWTEKFDEVSRSPFAFKGNQWVSFDDDKAVREKAEYILAKGLGGAMVWSIETDDYEGVCGSKYPILNTLKEVLLGGNHQGNTLETDVQNNESNFVQPESNGDIIPEDSPELPSQENSEMGQECTDGALFADPNSSGYIQCVRNDDGFITYYRDCPAGLRFVAETQRCDWA